MADLFPTDPKRIRERIRRYERALKKELEMRYGGDGYGKRFLLGPLYMLLGDVEGALSSFEWYESAYPGDDGDPYQCLTWSLALYRSNRREEAFNKLYQTILQNLYLVPHLLGKNPQPLNIWHGCNLAEIEYALDAPPELLALWDDEARQWARKVSEHPGVVEKVTQFIEVHRELIIERPGPRRTSLVEKSFKFQHYRFSDRV